MKLFFSLLLIGMIALISSCDPHVPPTIEFKTGGNYTSEDAAIAKGSTITIGVIAKKREDDMKTFNVSYAYDNATSTTTKETFTLSGSEQQNYDKDYSFTVRNQAGVEKWSFVITDRDGNLARLELTLTVN